MQNFIAPGDVLPLTAPSGGVVKGTAYKIGALVVIATVTADQTLPFSAMVTGVATVTKGIAGGSAFVQGAKVMWDNSAKNFTGATISDSGDVVVGVAVEAAADSATTGKVRLDGVAR